MSRSHSCHIEWGFGPGSETGGGKIDVFEIQVWNCLVMQVNAAEATQAGGLMVRVECVAKVILFAAFELLNVHWAPTLQLFCFGRKREKRVLYFLTSMETAGQKERPINTFGQRQLRRLAWLLKPRVRPALIAAMVFLIITQIVVLSPTALEKPPFAGSAPLAPEMLVDQRDEVLASGIPKSTIAEYIVERFEYVATREGEKQWKLHAERAFLYNEKKLVHARNIKAFIYDPTGKITVVTGKEAKYFMNERDLEIFGNVNVVFPDGFNLYSSYLRYLPNKRRIEMPVSIPVKGEGTIAEAAGNYVQFTSSGLEWNMNSSAPDSDRIVLPQGVTFNFESKRSGEGATTIVSDRSVVYRQKQLAQFTMNASRPIPSRFVQITQDTLHAKARTADLNYGDSSKIVEYLSLFDDVLIREFGKESALQYATAGRADFDSQRNVIVLSKFPQVYQDSDTVTGDIILLHRDTDVVEVQNSNAFSQGEKSQ
ncbi:MAG TPA: LPS export ABC transporter periplasmic protein LptC [Bdellovibrionales bacterium]|nr:LPS export ABC transporter periplasmic protein LptC [Bdellovibrionales bacterium]HCM41341.1 LPS export ABC transporter periplasmic protein LptC [Bdellovibrionales bacterium]